MNWSVLPRIDGSKTLSLRVSDGSRSTRLSPSKMKPAAVTSRFTASASMRCRVSVSRRPGTRLGGVVQHQVDAARFQRLEDLAVDHRQVGRAHELVVHVVVVLGGEHQVQLLRRGEVRQGVEDHRHVLIGRVAGDGGDGRLALGQLGQLVRHIGVDVALGPDGLGQDAGEVAAARDQVGHLPARPHPGEDRVWPGRRFSSRHHVGGEDGRRQRARRPCRAAACIARARRAGGGGGGHRAHGVVAQRRHGEHGDERRVAAYA